jgi:hypothetical protein
MDAFPRAKRLPHFFRVSRVSGTGGAVRGRVPDPPRRSWHLDQTNPARSGGW